MLKIKDKRIEKNIRRDELAKMLGVTTQCIYFYETGKREPNLETLKKMAQFFDCTIDELM